VWMGWRGQKVEQALEEEMKRMAVEVEVAL
jgi:hypothetical protein